MKVHELIQELSKLDQDADVSIEGCDCINPAQGVESWLDKRVLITADLGPEGDV